MKPGSGGIRLLLVLGGVLAVLAIAVGVAITWYTRGPGRDREVARLFEIAGMLPGLTVAEIGAGQGQMAVRVARRLGPAGHMFATEIEAEKLAAIRSAAAAAGLANVTVLQAGESSTNLAEACCDVIYMRRVYHHFNDSASIGISLMAALRPGGRLVVIDFLSPRWLFWMRHGIPIDVVANQLASAGFVPASRIDRWSPIDYCLVYRKPVRPD